MAKSNITIKLDIKTFVEQNEGHAAVNILGSEYTITFKPDKEVCSAMGVDIGECGGYCLAGEKKIVIANLDTCDGSDDEKTWTRQCNLRHEIVHAFLIESGLGFNSKDANCWAMNEEMVDWIALQGQKICKAWKEADALCSKTT